jgi:hypothetical protein
MIRYQPVGLEVNMRFIRFLIGSLLIIGSMVFGWWLGWPFALLDFGSWNASFIFWSVIDAIAFIGGIYLVRHH